MWLRLHPGAGRRRTGSSTSRRAVWCWLAPTANALAPGESPDGFVSRRRGWDNATAAGDAPGEVASTAGAAFLPLAELEESDDAFTVEVELSGVDKDDVNIEVSGRRVTVSGERKGVLRRRTRSVGRFSTRSCSRATSTRTTSPRR